TERKSPDDLGSSEKGNERIQNYGSELKINCDLRRGKETSMNKVRDHPKFSRKSSAYLITTDRKSNRLSRTKSSRSCVFCIGSHYNDECKIYPDRLARMNKVLELHLCDKCLRSGHLREACRTAVRPCYYCKEDYHSRCLCPVKFGKVSQSLSEEEPQRERRIPINTMVCQISDEDVNKDVSKERVESKHLRIRKKSLIGMKVTLVNLYDHRLKIRTVGFLDSGSDCSYVDEDIARRLKLKLSRPIEEEVKMFDSRNIRKLKFITTTVTVLTKLGAEEIRVASEDGLLQAVEDARDFIIRLEIEIEKAGESLKNDKEKSSHTTSKKTVSDDEDEDDEGV
uniref:DUF1758 domain-containing protein n=1 Tax=Syphacia muris TaxID=451379 RepID=A0A0N5ACL4_9BILA